MNLEEVFKGKLISYAQNNEDIILSGFFEASKPGFYVDVGANDPESGSVTKFFYDRGWKGINIEPIKDLFEKLSEARPRDTNLNIGVSNAHGKLKFREYGGSGLSTFSANMQKEYTDKPIVETKKHKDYLVDVKTLKSVFQDNDVRSIQFMKIDVEGYEYEVLEGNDWKKFRPEVICIEANHIEKNWKPLLKENDYKLIFFDGLNEYYTDKQRPDIEKRFSFIDTVILQEPIINYLLIPSLRFFADTKEKEIRNLEKKVESKDEYIRDLENKINEIVPLRKHIKKQLKWHLKKRTKKITRPNSTNQATHNPPKTEHYQDADSLQSLLKLAKDADSENYMKLQASSQKSQRSKSRRNEG